MDVNSKELNFQSCGKSSAAISEVDSCQCKKILANGKNLSADIIIWGGGH